MVQKCTFASCTEKISFPTQKKLSRRQRVNQVVTLDLKVHSATEYVLWCVDDATRFIRGEVVKDKKPETILDALERALIIGRGAGPGLP